MAKVEVTEIKTYKCSDGKVYDSKEMAEAHEIELKDPKYVTEQRFEELNKKIQDLQAQLLKLSARVECLESPWGKFNKKPISPQYPDSDGNPYQPQNGKMWYGTGENLTEALNNLKEVK